MQDHVVGVMRFKLNYRLAHFLREGPSKTVPAAAAQSQPERIGPTYRRLVSHQLGPDKVAEWLEAFQMGVPKPVLAEEYGYLPDDILSPAILARDGCLCQYRLMSMMQNDISGGVVHEAPEDLRHALASDAEALTAWEDLTPLARNEWICWTISVKKPETRQQHVERVRTELKEGVRRPCCWIGCIHRTDKSISPSVQYVLSKRSKRSS